MTQLSISSGQSNGASASASNLPVNIQGWFPSGMIGFISLLSKGLWKVLFLQKKKTVQKHQFFSTQPLYGPALISIHDYWKKRSLTIRTIVSEVISLIFNLLFLIAFFFLRSKCLLILWLQSPLTVILETKKINSVTVLTFSSSIYHEVMGPACHNLSFLDIEL